MAKKKAKPRKKADLSDSMHKVWLAGLGALATAGKEGEKLFHSLVDRGADYEKRINEPVERAGKNVRSKVQQVRSRAGRTLDDVQKAIDDQVTSALHRIGVPTRSEIVQLSRRVERLTRAVESPNGPARKKATKKTTKKSAKKSAKKPRAKKAAAKKTARRTTTRKATRADA